MRHGLCRCTDVAQAPHRAGRRGRHGAYPRGRHRSRTRPRRFWATRPRRSAPRATEARHRPRPCRRAPSSAHPDPPPASRWPAPPPAPCRPPPFLASLFLPLLASPAQRFFELFTWAAFLAAAPAFTARPEPRFTDEAAIAVVAAGAGEFPARRADRARAAFVALAGSREAPFLEKKSARKGQPRVVRAKTPLSESCPRVAASVAMPENI